MKIIDLRSDTVTKPTEAMRKAMYEAEVGDDVYKEDPTVNELERYTAELLGKESALFVPSGLMGNQISLNVHTNRSEEVICDINAHIFQYESGTPAANSGIQLYPVQGENGIITPELVEPVIRPESAYYMPRTKVIEVENTHNRAGGIIQPLDNIEKLSKLAQKYNLKFHLDGARLWNASVATDIPPADYCKYFDSVSVCLSKGLGAPIGSVIAGSKDFIEEAFRVRKAWGGGMRQVGILAAAGLYALQNNIQRLQEDHENAADLAKFLLELDSVELDQSLTQSNMLMFSPKTMSVEKCLAMMKEKGILMGVGNVGVIRAVTHMEVSKDDIDTAKRILNEILK